MATRLRSVTSPLLGPDTTSDKPQSGDIHWSMRLMSLVSLLTLAIYSYVLGVCHHQSRQDNARPNQHRNVAVEVRRMRFASLAFGLDLLISAYFGAATPLLLEKGGLAFDRKRLPRPLFWFFAITGLVPTASMALTIVGGRRWQARIKTRPGWRAFHGITALVAYFSWWLACAPIFFVVLVGEKRTLELLKKSKLLDEALL